MLRRAIDYAVQRKVEESLRRKLSLKIVWKTTCKNGRVRGVRGELNRVANSYDF